MRLLIILLLSALSLHSVAQTAGIDSLRVLLKNETDPKHKIELLNQLSFTLFDFDIEKAGEPTLQALELARKVKDKKGEGWALAYRGIYFFLSGMLMDAENHFNQSLAIGSSIGEVNLQTYSLTQLGNVNRDRGVFPQAFRYYNEAFQTSKLGSTDYYQSVVKLNLGRYYLIKHKPDSALKQIRELLKFREQRGDSILLADAWILMGNCYRGKEDFVEAERYYKKALPFTKKDEIISSDYLQNMGELFFVRGDFDKALENWSKVLSHYRKYQYKFALAELLLRIATVFEEQGYFELSSDYLNNALKISEKADYKYLIGCILHEQSWVYYRIRNFELALSSSKRASEIFQMLGSDFEVARSWDLRGLTERNMNHYDTALFYHKKSLDLRTRLGNKVEISAVLFNIGEYFMARRRYNEALPYYFKSLKIDDTLGDSYGISYNCNRLGKIYTQLTLFDSAKIYLDRAMLLAVPTSSNEVFRDNYMELAAYYEKLGKPNEAIPFYKNYIYLTDSILNKQAMQSLAAYRTLYDVERNEQQIELLSKDNELNKAIVERQQLVLFLWVAGSLILLGLVLFYYQFSRRQKKLNFELAEKNEEVQIQSKELMEANEVLSKLNREIEEQKLMIQNQSLELAQSNQLLEQRIEDRTSELKQAFKELDTFFYRASHDFRRPLTTFMGLAEVARVLLKDPAALELFEKVDENAHNLDRMLRKLQSISDVGTQEIFYREVFINEIFEIELDAFKLEIEKRKIKITVSSQMNHSFYSYPALIKIMIHNLLENAITFSSRPSPEIHLSAFEQAGEVVLKIEDNGIGIESQYLDRVFEMYFRANEHSTGNGLGLYIVKKTIQKLNGRIILESIIGKGTTVMVFLPHRLK